VYRSVDVCAEAQFVERGKVDDNQDCDSSDYLGVRQGKSGYPVRDARFHLRTNRHRESVYSALASDFAYAGTSAILLLISNLLPSYWYLSLVALTPFLLRISRANISQAVRLGLAYFSVFCIDYVAIDPLRGLAHVVLGTAALGLFGLTFALVRSRLGFNPVVVALLWILFQGAFLQFGYRDFLLLNVNLSNPFIHGFAALFGILVLSCIIVLAASMLALAICKIISLAPARVRMGHRCSGSRIVSENRCYSLQDAFLIPEGRGPPAFVFS